MRRPPPACARAGPPYSGASALTFALLAAMSPSLQAPRTSPRSDHRGTDALDPGWSSALRTASTGHRGTGLGHVSPARRRSRILLPSLADILRSVRGMYVTAIALQLRRDPRLRKPETNTASAADQRHRVNDNIIGQAEVGRSSASIQPCSTVSRSSAVRLVALRRQRALRVVKSSPCPAHPSTAARHRRGRTLGTQLVRTTPGAFWHGADVAVSATFARSDGVPRLYFPAFDTPATNNGIAEGSTGKASGNSLT